MWLGIPRIIPLRRMGDDHDNLGSTGRPAASRRDVLPDGPGVAVTTSPVLALAATTEPAQVTTRSNTKGTRAIGHGYHEGRHADLLQTDAPKGTDMTDQLMPATSPPTNIRRNRRRNPLGFIIYKDIIYRWYLYLFAVMGIIIIYTDLHVYHADEIELRSIEYLPLFGSGLIITFIVIGFLEWSIYRREIHHWVRNSLGHIRFFLRECESRNLFFTRSFLWILEDEFIASSIWDDKISRWLSDEEATRFAALKQSQHDIYLEIRGLVNLEEKRRLDYTDFVAKSIPHKSKSLREKLEDVNNVAQLALERSDAAYLDYARIIVADRNSQLHAIFGKNALDDHLGLVADEISSRLNIKQKLDRYRAEYQELRAMVWQTSDPDEI